MIKTDVDVKKEGEVIATIEVPQGENVAAIVEYLGEAVVTKFLNATISREFVRVAKNEFAKENASAEAVMLKLANYIPGHKSIAFSAKNFVEICLEYSSDSRWEELAEANEMRQAEGDEAAFNYLLANK